MTRFPVAHAQFLILVAVATTSAQAPSPANPLADLRPGPKTTVVMQPLNDQGYPDYVAALNKELAEGIAPDENFWAAFIPVMSIRKLYPEYVAELPKYKGFETTLAPQARFQDLEDGVSKEEGLERLSAMYETIKSPWRSTDYPDMSKWLDSNAEPLRIATVAAKRPKAFAPLIGQTVVDLHQNHAGQAGQIAKALVIRAQRSLAEGRTDEAWQDLLTCRRIANHMSASGEIWSLLGSFSVKEYSHDAIAHCIADRAVTPQILQRRWRELAPLLRSPNHAQIARMERFEILTHMFEFWIGVHSTAAEGDPNSAKDKQVVEQERELLKRVGLNELLERCNQFLDELNMARRQPTFAARQQAIDQVHDNLKKESELSLPDGRRADSAVRARLIQHYALGGPMDFALARDLARTRMLHAAFAAELHRRRTGEDVRDRKELVAIAPRLANLAGVRDVPILEDPYNGAPLCVRAGEAELLIYSVCQNLKDDGGLKVGEGDDTDDIVTRLPRTR